MARFAPYEELPSTADEFLLQSYYDVKAKLEMAERKNEELEAALAEKPSEEQTDEELESRPTAWRLNEPIELVRLDIAASYHYEDKDNPLAMTADEIREAVSTREGLEALCERQVSYGPYSLLSVECVICQFQIVVLGRTWGLNASKGYRNDWFSLSEYLVENAKDGFNEGEYYRSEHREALYEWGLEKLKKQLLDYADKLDKEVE